jgi:DNA-binding XRE family transcriptional regulator
MSIDYKTKVYGYRNELYKTVADLYIIDKLSISNSCAKIGISKQTYYNICKKLCYPSVSIMKDARLSFILNENKHTEIP